jgi:hypothetical protein
MEMNEVYKNFIGANNFIAIYNTLTDTLLLLCESRVLADGQQVFYTNVDGSEIYANSIHDFVRNDTKCISLSIEHPVYVGSKGETNEAILTEQFIRAENDNIAPIHFKTILSIGDKLYESDECDTLTDSIEELLEILGKDQRCRLQICHCCNFSWPAFLHPVSERDELRCFRDAPVDLFEEVLAKGKFASKNARFSGHYYVNAFHRCAAWQPIRKNDGK